MAEQLKIIPLGGLNEIGKNMTVYEYGGEIIVVDCGMAFPGDDMYGIDCVIPDVSYLVKHKNRIRGMFITHGHEDHIGAVPYILKKVNIPIYCTRLTAGLIRLKLEEHGLLKSTKIVTVESGMTVKAGKFSVEFIHVNHSIADSVAFAIHTGLGTVVHTGDFKIDSTPIDGEVIDLARFGELGKQGVLALLADSTNVERPGYTMSERTVGRTFNRLFQGCKQRIIVTTFASNVHRIQQIMDAAAECGRKVAVTGRSMENVTKVAMDLGYMKPPKTPWSTSTRSSRCRLKSRSSSPPARRARRCPPCTAWRSPSTSRSRSAPATASSSRRAPSPATRTPSRVSSTSSSARALRSSTTARTCCTFRAMRARRSSRSSTR